MRGSLEGGLQTYMWRWAGYDVNIWNMAAIGKIIWSIAHKKDNLWIKWVHTIYIKEKSWRDYKPTYICSWVWKGLGGVKDQMLANHIDIYAARYSI